MFMNAYSSNRFFLFFFFIEALLTFRMSSYIDYADWPTLVRICNGFFLIKFLFTIENIVLCLNVFSRICCLFYKYHYNHKLYVMGMKKSKLIPNYSIYLNFYN